MRWNGAECPNCGSDDTIPVWEDTDDFEDGEPPDHLGCLACNEMATLEVADSFGMVLRVGDEVGGAGE